MRLYYFLLLIIVFFVFSCTAGKEEPTEKPIARVAEKFLYPSDIKNIVPKKTSPNDSISIIKNYIESWIRKQLMISKAEQNLAPEEKDMEEQLENYKASILIYRYEQNFIKQKMDTTVSDEEAEKYYQENSKEFILDHNIVKALFIQLPKSAPKIIKVRQWYKSDNENDLAQLENFCFENATKYDNFQDEWIAFDDILNRIPEKIYNQEDFLKSARTIETADSSYLFFIKIREYKTKSNIAPFPIVKYRVRQVILNKRKLELIKNLEQSIYQDGFTKKEFEIFK